ncbi:MAG: DMT family transporter [Candidatus Sedimenticola endophacoides]
MVYLIVRGELGLLLRLDPNRGDLWILAATLAWAVYSLLLRRWKPAALSPISFLTFTMLVGVGLLGALHWSGVTGEAPIIWGHGELISIGYFALFPSLVSFICWNEGVARVGAPTAGHFIHLMPLFGTLLSVLLLGERVLPYHLAGAVLDRDRDPGIAEARLRGVQGSGRASGKEGNSRLLSAILSHREQGIFALAHTAGMVAKWRKT